MKIYARQTDPAYQEPYWYHDDTLLDLQGLAIMPDRNNAGRMPDDVENVHKILNEGELHDAIVYPEEYGYKNATEAISDYLPKATGKYSTRDISKIKKIITGYTGGTEELMAAMTITTGAEWCCGSIVGCSQGDYAEIIYRPDMWNKKAISDFETEYFNTGSEWVIHDEDTPPSDPDDINGFSMYCHGWTDEQIKAEIAQVTNGKPEEVVLYKFDGYTKRAKYVIA